MAIRTRFALMIGRLCCLFFSVFLLTAGTGAWAQNSNLKLIGTVLHSQTRKPLESVTVIKTSTRRGTITDVKGQFRLFITPGDTIIVRAVGFKPVQYVVNLRTQADITTEILLEEGAQELPEVKVVGGLDYEKVNRALRNMKKPAPSKNNVAKPPPPKPLFPEKKSTPVAPSIDNPASLLYDLLSKEGKDRRRLEEMQAEEAARKKALEDQKKKQAYDSLFIDRNKDFK